MIATNTYETPYVDQRPASSYLMSDLKIITNSAYRLLEMQTDLIMVQNSLVSSRHSFAMVNSIAVVPPNLHKLIEI